VVPVAVATPRSDASSESFDPPRCKSPGLSATQARTRCLPIAKERRSKTFAKSSSDARLDRRQFTPSEWWRARTGHDRYPYCSASGAALVEP